MACRFANRPKEAYTVGDELIPIEGPMLCGWAMDRQPEALDNVPRWLQRNALAGHLLKYPEDCEGCACRQEKEQ